MPSSTFKRGPHCVRVIHPFEEGAHRVIEHEMVKARRIESPHALEVVNVLEEELVQNLRESGSSRTVARDIEPSTLL